MTKAPPYRFTSVSLAILSLTLVVFAVINLQQRVRYRLPDDGVSWVDAQGGVEAWIVTPDGPADRAGIREGDLLESIDKKPIHAAADAAREIFHDDIWSQTSYTLVRNGEKFQTSLVLVPQKAAATVRYYLSLVGLIYLVIGTFILLRRWTAPKSLHFYVFCLASFILYTFSYTGKLNLFDWMVYWLEVPAFLPWFSRAEDFPARPALCDTLPLRSSGSPGGCSCPGGHGAHGFPHAPAPGTLAC
jgi:hypothetical protein